MDSQHEPEPKKPLQLWPCVGPRASERGKVATSTRAAVAREKASTGDRLKQPPTVSSAQEPHGAKESQVLSDSAVYPQHSLTPHQRSRREDDGEADKETQTTSRDGSKPEWSHPGTLDYTRLRNHQAKSAHQRAGKRPRQSSSLRRESGTQTNATLPDHLARIVQGYWMQLALKKALQQ